MSQNKNLDKLEENIEQLLQLCGHLRDENAELRRTVEHLQREQKTILDRQDKAREQIDQVIDKVEREINERS